MTFYRDPKALPSLGILQMCAWTSKDIRRTDVLVHQPAPTPTPAPAPAAPVQDISQQLVSLSRQNERLLLQLTDTERQLTALTDRVVNAPWWLLLWNRNAIIGR